PREVRRRRHLLLPELEDRLAALDRLRPAEADVCVVDVPVVDAPAAVFCEVAWSLDEEAALELEPRVLPGPRQWADQTRKKDRKSTRLNSSHRTISYAVFCLKKKKKTENTTAPQ